MKSFRKAEHKKRAEAGKAPEGWTLYQDGFSFAPVYPLEAGEVFEGIVMSVRAIEVTRDGHKVPVRLMTFDTGGEDRAFWESAALAPLFDDAKVGDSVRIEYLGMVEMPAPKSPMRDYRVWVQSRDEG